MVSVYFQARGSEITLDLRTLFEVKSASQAELPMKAKLYSLALVSLLTVTAMAAQTVPVRMYCLSIETDHGIDEFGDTLDVNYANRSGSAGELGISWAFGPGYYDLELPGNSSYMSSLAIYDSYYKRTYSGSLSVDMPISTDNNNNRFPDFFEVSQSANYQSSGGYLIYVSTAAEYGLIQATWTRDAGSWTGTYQWTCTGYSGPLPSDWFGTFVGTFKILEYTGTMTYTPGASTVSATVNLVQTGMPANTRQGSIQFTKSDSDRFNSLTNQPGFWTNSSSQVYTFTNHALLRDPNYPTNYAGYVEFDDDGDQSTVYPYAVWVLSIDDPNDINQNGIPDFSDDPLILPAPRRPLISLASSTTNLLFTIHGDINHVHQIQQAPSVNSANWQNVISVTLTNDPQVVPVPLPTGTAFFRVQAQ